MFCENEIQENVRISALRNEMFWKVVIVAELKLALPCPVHTVFYKNFSRQNGKVIVKFDATRNIL